MSAKEEKRVIMGSVRDTPLSKQAGTVARALTEQGIAAARVAGSGGRIGGGSGGMSGLAGGFGSGGAGGLPSVLATGSPLSVFQYTLARPDRLALFRYFSRTDPFVGRAIELHSELPLSRLSIGMPKGDNAKQNREINRIYENMVDRLGLMEFLLEVAREYWMAGDVYIWHEWNEEIGEWDDVYILPVEYLHSITNPFKRRSELVLWHRPIVDTAAIRRMTDRDLYTLAGDPDLEKLIEEVEDEVPEDLKRLLDYNEAQVLNTDPKKGSFVYHIARNRPPNEAYGMGLLERCMETLLRLENLKNAQLQISGRNMQPKHLIYAEGLSAKEIDDLRAQVDMALLENVDFPIVTNYAVTWQTIGANDRLLQVEGEYTMLQEALATGLGTTKEMLTGQATYGGQRITLELMNTQYLTFRELIKDYVERCIFRPVAEAKGHYFAEELDIWVKCDPIDLEAGDEVIQEHDGTLRKRAVQINKVYNHSRLRFNRLALTDNAEKYEQLFQLHQKGSLALRYLLELHNIDAEENNNAILEDLGTPRDPVFNRLVENLYPAAAPMILAETDILDRIIRGLNLDVNSRSKNEPSPGLDTQGYAGGGGSPDPMAGGMDSMPPDLATPPPVPSTPTGPQGDQGPDDLSGVAVASFDPFGRASSTIVSPKFTAALRLPGKRLKASEIENLRTIARRARLDERLKTRKARRGGSGAGDPVTGEGEIER